MSKKSYPKPQIHVMKSLFKDNAIITNMKNMKTNLIINNQAMCVGNPIYPILLNICIDN